MPGFASYSGFGAVIAFLSRGTSRALRSSGDASRARSDELEKPAEIAEFVDAHHLLLDARDLFTIEREARKMVELGEEVLLRHRRARVALRHVHLARQHLAVLQRDLDARGRHLRVACLDGGIG